MNVLVNAYAISPTWGSEPGVGWNWVIRLAKKCHVFVITEEEWRKEIEETLPGLPQRDNIRFYFNPVSQKVRDICWNQGDWRFYFYYRKWQKRALEIARDIVSHHRIDIIHQLNMIGFREPGYLWQIEDIPFIWGPIGNMETLNMEFAQGLPIIQKQKLRLKNWLTYFQARNGRVAKAAIRADTVYAALEGTASIIKSVYGKERVYVLPETGLEMDPLVEHDFSDCKRPLEILWVGRFIPTKKLDLALEVLSGLVNVDFKFHIVGWGNAHEDVDFKKMADKLGIGNQCIWHGKITHEEVQQMMRESDLFLFTSVVEGTPHVVLEAISNNLPVVCFDLCGQGVIVDDTVGIKVKADDTQQMRREMADVINELSKDRAKLEAMSKACEKRKPLLSWDAKIDLVFQCYANAIERNNN